MGIKALVRVATTPAIIAAIKAWDDMDYAQRSTAYAAALREGGAKTQRQTKPGYLIPIILGIGKKTLTKCRILEQASGPNASGLPAELRQITVNRVFETEADAGTGFETPPYDAFKRPARVTLIVKTPNTAERTSRFTGRKYKGMNTDSASQSFGANKTAPAATEGDYDEVRTKAGAAVGSATNKSYKITPEGSR